MYAAHNLEGDDSESDRKTQKDATTCNAKRMPVASVCELSLASLCCFPPTNPCSTKSENISLKLTQAGQRVLGCVSLDSAQTLVANLVPSSAEPPSCKSRFSAVPNDQRLALKYGKYGKHFMLLDVHEQFTATDKAHDCFTVQLLHDSLQRSCEKRHALSRLLAISQGSHETCAKVAK